MKCGISTPVVCHLPKVEKRVRFSYPAPVSDQMDANQITIAINSLQEAEQKATYAIRLEKSGNTGGALKEWYELFGSRFAMS